MAINPNSIIPRPKKRSLSNDPQVVKTDERFFGLVGDKLTEPLYESIVDLVLLSRKAHPEMDVRTTRSF